MALKRSAHQVDTDWGGVASRAVDGNVSTDFFKDSCTHTTTVNDPWWRVDLGSAFSVAEVVIVNRACTGVCGTRLQGFEIRIGKFPVIQYKKDYRVCLHGIVCDKN